MFIGFTEMMRERERSSEQETLIGRLLYMPQLRDWICNLGMCPDQESKPQPFDAREDAPINWATQPGQ